MAQGLDAEQGGQRIGEDGVYTPNRPIIFRQGSRDEWLCVRAATPVLQVDATTPLNLQVYPDPGLLSTSITVPYPDNLNQMLTKGDYVDALAVSLDEVARRENVRLGCTFDRATDSLSLNFYSLYSDEPLQLPLSDTEFELMEEAAADGLYGGTDYGHQVLVVPNHYRLTRKINLLFGYRRLNFTYRNAEKREIKAEDEKPILAPASDSSRAQAMITNLTLRSLHTQQLLKAVGPLVLSYMPTEGAPTHVPVCLLVPNLGNECWEQAPLSFGGGQQQGPGGPPVAHFRPDPSGRDNRLTFILNKIDPPSPDHDDPTLTPTCLPCLLQVRAFMSASLHPRQAHDDEQEEDHVLSLPY